MQIGEFLADPASNEISAAGKTTRLRPILMDVLLRLAADGGNAVNRETLLNDVWPRRMVNDEVLSRAIAELRTALGDDPKHPRYIETLPKIGYRLIASVESTAQSSDLLQAAGAIPVSVPETAHAADETRSTPVAPKPRPAADAHEETLPTLTETVAATPDATTPQRVSLWKLIRLPLIGVAALALYGVYKTQPLSASVSRQIELERQISAAVPFATSPQTESNPRFAPDGKSVVFARSGETTSEIVIQDITSGTQRAFSVANARVASPVFMPDGKRVAYWLRRTAPASGQPDCAIALRDLDRGTDTVLVDCQQRPQPVFDLSADGTSLTYAALPRADYPLALMRRNLAARSTEQLTAPAPGEGHDAYPRVSPDGKTVAFFRGTQSHVRLWTLALVPAPKSAAAGSAAGELPKPQPASALEGLSYGVAWLPRGGGLVAAADWLGFRALNAVSLTDGSARLLGARGARFPDVHSNGSLVFETATYRADLWLSGVDNTGTTANAARVLWPSTRYSNQPEFSPDGKRVVFASNRSGSDAIHVAALDGEPQRLPLSSNARYIQPHWSADGNEVFAVRIAVTDGKPAPQHAVRIRPGGGETTELTHLGSKVNNAVPLANGRDVLYGELAEHAMRLYRAPIAGGTPERLPLPLVASFAAVGNDLVFTQPQLTGATRCKLDTMACTPVKVELDDSLRFDWTLSPGALWFAGRDGNKRVLVRLDLDGGQRRNIDLAPSAAGTNIAISRDGQSIIVAREAPAVVDLMIAKPLP